MKKVEVWLYETSEPLVFNAKSTYTTLYHSTNANLLTSYCVIIV